MMNTMIERAFRRGDGAVQDLIEDETGDVPGWVLIVLMTAGLVVLVWSLAGPALQKLFTDAIARVSGM